MKKTILIMLFPLLLWGCYDDYVRDYDYSGIYYAYQYNLRTFVVGEGMQFKTGVALGGVMENTRDRKVKFVIDDAMVTGDLSSYIEQEPGEEAFTAYDVMSGKSTQGTVSNAYVTNAIKKAGLGELAPLPPEYFTISNRHYMTIGKGRHTGTVTITATDAFFNDAKATDPYYAIALRIVDADADKILPSKGFSVIAVRCENKFFGNYYHGGVTTIRDRVTGEEISSTSYQTTIPQDETRIYTLNTVAPNAVVTNRLANGAGSLRLEFDETMTNITVTSDDKTIEFDGPSKFNGAKLLQDRKLFLNYRFDNGDGTATHVKDTLTFRNRIRDGVNEWQDENPENYK